MTKIDEFKNIPPEVLTEISDDEFSKKIDENQTAKNMNPEPEDEEDLDDIAAETVIDAAESGNDVNLGELFDPEDATEIIDLIMTPLTSMAAKGMKLKATDKDLELTPKNKKTLNKITGKALKFINLKKINPVVLLLIVVLILYGMKLGKLYVSQKMLDDAEDEGYKRGKKDTEEQLKDALDQLKQLSQKGTPLPAARTRKNKAGAGRPKKNIS